MAPITILLSALCLVVAVVLAIVALTRTPEATAAQFSARVGLRLPEPPLDARIARRVRRRTRWVLLSSIAGLGLAVAGTLAAVAAGVVPDPEAQMAWLCIAGLVLGGALGSLGAVLTERGTADPRAPRYAHARATRLSDYLDAIELVGARVAGALGALGGIAVTVLPQPETTPAPTALAGTILAGVGVIGLAILEIGGRRLVLSRAPLAESPAALAWNDALRADELRTLATAPIMAGSYAFILTAFPVLTALIPARADNTATLVAANACMLLLIAIAVVLAVLSVVRKPAQFYLRRLWPTVAAQAPGQDPAR